MKKTNKIFVAMLCLVAIFLVSCGSKGSYKKNFANKDYLHLFTEEEDEYYSGSKGNVIMFKDDKVIISEMVESEMYKQKKSKSESGPKYYLDEREYQNPIYDKENDEIKADGLEETIKVKEDGDIEFNGKVYTNNPDKVNLNNPDVEGTENK